MPAVANRLRHADSARVVNEAREHESEHARVESMARENVIAQLSNTLMHPSVRLALAEKRGALHGWVYVIESGRIDANDGASQQFVSLADNPEVRAFPVPILAAA